MAILPAFVTRKARVKLKAANFQSDDMWYGLLNLTGVVTEIELHAQLIDENRGKHDSKGNPKPPNYIPTTRHEPNGFVFVRFETVDGIRLIHCPATDLDPA